MEIYASKEDIGNIRADLAGLEGRLREAIRDHAASLVTHANEDRADFTAVNSRVEGLKSTIDSALGAFAALRWMVAILMALSAAGTIKLFLK